MKDRKLIAYNSLVIALIIAVAFFIMGWLFPIEGPLDFVYDKYASQPAHKQPQKFAPIVTSKLIIDINDLSEEDFRALEAIFVNKGNRE